MELYWMEAILWMSGKRKDCRTPAELRGSGSFLDWYISGFYYVGADNRRPIRELMTHLYEVHGCRRFVFAGGRKMLSEILNVLLRTANA